MTRRRGGETSQRQLRVGEEVRHTLAHIFERGGLHDPDLVDAHVTVSEVRMSPDLKVATAFVARFGGGEAGALIGACRRAAPYLRRQVAAALALRFAPEIRFQPDTSFDQASRIEAVLRRLFRQQLCRRRSLLS